MTPNGDKLEELDLYNEISDLNAKVSVLQARIRSALDVISIAQDYHTIPPETAKRIRKALGVAS